MMKRTCTWLLHCMPGIGLSLALVLGLGTVALAQDPAPNPSPLFKVNEDMVKAVIHINFDDADRQEHGLKNIENILKEANDAQIVVVIHGQGISLLSKKKTKQTELIQKLMKSGVKFEACENTMKKESLSKEDLVDGSTTVPSGAVEVLRKQSEGFGYFKP